MTTGSSTGWGIPALAGVIATAVVLAGTRLGIGATPDSGHYLATAENVLAGRGFVRLGGEIMASWPPLYPTLLAIIGWLGLDMLQGARILAAVLTGALTVVATRWIAIRLGSSAWTAFAGICLALGPPLVYSGSLALSDLPFIFLQVAALRLLDGWLTHGRASRLIACAVCLALACLTRYNGVVLVATVALSILMLAHRPLLVRVRIAALTAIAAAAPLALWLVRNYRLTGAPAGPRVPSETGVLEHATDAGYTVMSWFVPYRVLTVTDIAGLVLTTLAVVVILAVAVRYRRQAEARMALVCAVFVVLFLGFMVVTSALMAMDALTQRMMAPVYVPLLLAATACAALLVRQAPAPRRRLAAAAAALGAVVVAVVITSRTGLEIHDSWHNGPGGVTHSNFNTDAWRSSPTLQWAGEHLRDELVFASSPAALYLATGADSRPMPRKHARRNPGVPYDDLSKIRDEIAAAGEAYLIVNKRSVPTNVFPVEELSPTLHVERIQTFPDGSIYRLRPGSGPVLP